MRKVFLFTLLFPSLLSAAQDTTRLSLLFLGDIMQHDSQIADAYHSNTGTYNYKPCFQYVEPYIKGVDIAIGNLEVTLAGKPYKGYPQFSAPDELAAGLKDIGMDVLVTANNHCVDRGRQGLERTIDLLDRFGILHTGTFKTQTEKQKTYPLILEQTGFKIALLNYTYGTNGMPVIKPNIVNMLDTGAMRKDLIKAENLHPDVVIVFTHWGAEYQSLPSKREIEIAEWCFKHGADIVVGSHPHVVQPMEWRKQENRLLAYSLGNFVSGQRKRYTDGGAMLRMELEKIDFSDGSSHTQIDTAGYILEWVYRTNDAEKNYYVLPVPEVEEKPAGYIKDASSREAFKTFVSDSRKLFQKYNVDMEEFDSRADLSVQFKATDTLSIRKYLEQHTGLRSINDRLYPTIKVGPLTYPDAMHLYRRLRSELPVEALEIIEEKQR
jgi:hypothetical protein